MVLEIVFLEQSHISYMGIQTVIEIFVLLGYNPQRFIESNLEQSWIQYLNNMSSQGTWADGIIIQAVADVFNLKIHIIESHPDFAEITLVEGVTAPCSDESAVFIGHLDEFHYVSTEPLPCCPSISKEQNKQTIVKPVENISSVHNISFQGSPKPSSQSSRKHFMNFCLTQPGKFSCAVDCYLELASAIFKDSLKHTCIDNNDFFHIVLKACLQLENNDQLADLTVVREPVWAYLKQHCYSFATLSDNAIFSDDARIKSLFLVQKTSKSICSSCNKALLNNTTLFTLYITSLNLPQNKFEDGLSSAMFKKNSRLRCDVCQNNSRDFSMQQDFVVLPIFLCVELSSSVAVIDLLFFKA